jgi:hypothetical protein
MSILLSNSISNALTSIDGTSEKFQTTPNLSRYFMTSPGKSRIVYDSGYRFAIFSAKITLIINGSTYTDTVPEYYPRHDAEREVSHS